MANKVLDLLLKLTVQGGQDADKLRTSVEGLKKASNDLKGMAKLDELFGGTRAKQQVEDVFTAFTRLAAEIRRVGSIKFVDFDPTGGKVDLLVQKGRQLVDLVAQIGRQRIDLDLTQSQKQLDLIAAKAREAYARLSQLKGFRIDLDVTKSAAEVDKLGRSLSTLRPQISGVTSEVARLTAQNKGLLQAVEDTGRGFLLFRRLLFGLGLVTAVREVLELVKGFDRVRQSLETVFGQTQAAEEFAFIREQAERLGVSVIDLGEQYSKFTIASRSLGLSQQEIRDVFLATAEAGAKLSLSTEQVAGTLTALQQIASKGRLSMEELRQQLGDRLPGAISIAAKALGVTEARLFQLVEAGQVASDVFLRQFPAALRASFGTDATTRINTTQAAISRFQNTLKETIDTAVRAGALDAFTDSLREMGKALQNPAVISFFKSFSEFVGAATKAIIEHAQAIKLLIIAYGSFKVLSLATAAFQSLGGALIKFTGVAGPAAVVAEKVASGARVLTKDAGGAVAPVNALATALSVLASLTRNPYVLTFSIAISGGLALIKAIADEVERVQNKTLDAKMAVDSFNAAIAGAKALQPQIDALSDYSDVLAKSSEEINKLSSDSLRWYNESAVGAQKLAQLQADQAAGNIAGLRAQQAAGQLTIDQLNENIRQIDRLKVVQADAQAKSDAFTASLKAIGEAAKVSGTTLDLEFFGRMANVSAQLKLVDTGVKSVAVSIKKIEFKDLSKDAQAVATSFKNAADKGLSLADSIRKALPKNFLDGRVKEITDVGNALAFLVQEGAIPAGEAIEDLALAFDKLKGNELAALAINAQNAFETLTLSAQGLDLLLNSSLIAGLKNMGLEADSAGKKISKTFKELLDNFAAVAQNVKITGDQLKGALDIAIAAAKTKQELEALKATIEQLGIAGGQFGQALEDSLAKLDDALRIAGGKLDTALGDSFKRLGVVSKQELKAMADQAIVDFNRIKASGQATALELEAAWRKMAEEVTRLNNGIPPINILINAVDFNAFDLIVKAAEDASARTKRAILDAIPLVETAKQARALGDAIKEAFDKGKISAAEFGELITTVGFQMRELAAKPVGELAASAELLGLKTRDQLKAVADNAKEAFSSVLSSGQFTNEELAKGAETFLNAYKAANDGVIDSFDPVVAAAMEVLESVNKNIDALDKLQSKAKNFTLDIGNLNDMSVAQLQDLLSSTIKAYQSLGQNNIENLQIFKEINKELQERGRESAEKMREEFEKSATALEDGAKKLADAGSGAARPAGGGGGGIGLPRGTGLPPGTPPETPVVNNFNFSNATVTPDQVKREVLPAISTIMRRRR